MTDNLITPLKIGLYIGLVESTEGKAIVDHTSICTPHHF